MADEQKMTKRERQKARRQQRLEAERAAQRTQKAKKSVATFAVMAVVVGALGVWGVSAWQDRQERIQLMAEAQENLEEYGCTPIEESPVTSANHLSGSQLASSPPDALYPDRPAPSGDHIGSVVQSGFYDKIIDERLVLHNMEHGYVNFYYEEDADPEVIEGIREFVESEIDNGTEKLLAMKWDGDLPGDYQFAMTAWGARQMCERWNRGVALAFVSDWHYLEGNAPERTLQPHRGGLGGGIDPNEEEGDLLFPPLGEVDTPEGDVMDDPNVTGSEPADGGTDASEPAEDASDEPTEDGSEEPGR